MNTVKYEALNTKTVAHRGMSGLEMENTCSAFVAAGNRSHFGIETDVHVTADGQYIIIHDDTTGRVAADNLQVEQSTFETLRSLRLLDTDGKKGRNDLRLPSLEEYILICKKYGKTAVLELKNAFKRDEVFEIASIIDSLGWLENTIFISFALENLVVLREKYPTQAAQYLVDDFSDTLIATLKKHSLDLDIKYTALTQENVRLLHENGIKINCWTCNDKAEGEKLAKWGVEYITSNILE